MTRSPLALGLRTIAIAIAVAALIDPVVISKRATKPVVALIADTADASLASRVERAIGKTATVVRASTSTADASVIVGNALPTSFEELHGPVFAVLGDRSAPSVALTSIDAPAWTPSDARAPIVSGLHVTNARGKSLDVALRRGDLVVDRATRTIGSDDERATVTLGFVPTALGATPLRVTAHVAGAEVSGDAVVDVREKKWAVLFYDPRPSWMSRFVRRAIEDDSRFAIASRVVTSRNVSTDAGAPPGRLDDLSALQLYDAIVVGAPEALSANDVAGLEGFMRRRGGSVLLLFDRRAPGSYERLTQVASWSADSGKAASIAMIASDTSSLRASEIAWPARLPEGSIAIARTGDRPVVWRSSIGAGQLIVSGALDAWRFRDRSTMSFDRFWRSIIADAVSNASPAIEIATDRASIAPSGKASVSVTLRDAALSESKSIRAGVVATLEAAGKPASTVRLWPSGSPGEFRGEVSGAATGMYRLAVASGGARAEAPIVVASDAAAPTVDARDIAAAVATAHGGRALDVSELNSLPRLLTESIKPAPRVETWYPMRSAWWILPFALALSGEWWLRRRRGLT